MVFLTKNELIVSTLHLHFIHTGQSKNIFTDFRKFSLWYHNHLFIDKDETFKGSVYLSYVFHIDHKGVVTANEKGKKDSIMQLTQGEGNVTIFAIFKFYDCSWPFGPAVDDGVWIYIDVSFINRDKDFIRRHGFGIK